MRLKDVPKYTTVDTVLQLTREQKIKLWHECKQGRSCYLVDYNCNQGSFFEDAFTEFGELICL